MSWTCHKLPVVDGNLEQRLLGAFKRANQRAGMPADVAVFRQRLGARGAAYFFSPAAGGIAAAAMSEMGFSAGPAACARPARTTEQIVGGPDTWRRLFEGDSALA